MDDISNLRDTATPKSDQLNADDLINTTKIIRITGVKRGASKEQPISIEYDNMQGRPFKPCKSMRRLLIAAYGEDGREWVACVRCDYTDVRPTEVTMKEPDEEHDNETGVVRFKP